MCYNRCKSGEDRTLSATQLSVGIISSLILIGLLVVVEERLPVGEGEMR